MWDARGKREKIDFQTGEVRKRTNAVDSGRRKLVERRHAGAIGVVIDGGEGGGRELDPVGVVEEERVHVRSVNDAGNDETLLVVGNEKSEAASAEPVAAEVQNVFSMLEEATEEDGYIIEHKGPRALDAVHHIHDAVTRFQLLKDDRRIVHAFGDLCFHNLRSSTSIPPNTSPFHRNTSPRSFISGCL